MFVITMAVALIVVPWYGLTHGFSAAEWAVALAFTFLNGLGITAGYHRLWAHKTYEAHWTVRLVLLVFGTMALQNSAFVWCSGHRRHHLNVDDVDAGPVLGPPRLLVLAHRLDAARVPERRGPTSATSRT